jgi:hypothetical protein
MAKVTIKGDAKKIVKMLGRRTYWMHTIDGRPAAFDGYQICYWWPGAKLATSLKQIKRECVLTEKWRLRMGLDLHPSSYSHITLRLL